MRGLAARGKNEALLTPEKDVDRASGYPRHERAPLRSWNLRRHAREHSLELHEHLFRRAAAGPRLLGEFRDLLIQFPADARLSRRHGTAIHIRGEIEPAQLALEELC